MAAHTTKGFVPVLAALIGNALVAIVKIIVAISSGSSAMFSESVHSIADTSNQALLLLGVTRSRKKPTKEHSYGYGGERFFWAIISACGIFFVGAGVTVYHGAHTILYPEQITINANTFIVLFIALIVESLTLWIALA